MKKLLFALAILSTSSVFAAPRLLQLDCRLSNGTRMISSDSGPRGLEVTAHIGQMSEDLKVVLTKQTAANQKIIHLINRDGQIAYYLYLPIDFKGEIYQDVSGTMKKMSSDSKSMILVANADCGVIIND